MKKIAILAITCLLFSSNAIIAQTVITNTGNKQVTELSGTALADAITISNDTIRKEAEKEVILKSTKVTIPNRGGTITIVTDDIGQVRKTIFEIPSTKKRKRRYQSYYYNTFVDMGLNRVDSKNLFTGKEDISSTDFPKINNSKSVSVAVYPIVATIRPVKFWGLSAGVGIEWFNYRFNKGMSLMDDNGVTKAMPAWQVFGFNQEYAILKTKLTASYLNIPVMMQFYFSNRDRFNIMAGATFGVNIGSHTKVKYAGESGEKHKVKIHEDLNMSSFRYGFTARINWDCVGIYANYYMTPLFKNDKGPKVYPFVVGISLNFNDIFWWW
jgi:hypothetical protein